MGLARKFGIVLWKNAVLKKRHWLATLLEIVVPTVLFIAVAVMRTSLDAPDQRNSEEPFTEINQ